MMTVLCLLSPASAEEERAWTVGFSAQEILPDAQRLERSEYFLAGYSSNHPASGLLDAQYARAVWLDDGSGEGGVILMAVDCVGLTSVDTGVIRDRLASFSEETGCRYVHVCATHKGFIVQILIKFGCELLSIYKLATCKIIKFIFILYYI